MPDIVLTTLNARYIHAAFGLRYLLANLGDLSDRAVILEFDINQRSTEIIERILTANPKIVGIGVYIWNVEPATRVVAELKRLRPDLVIVLGGPEVSYETDLQEICRLADFVITGEGDLAFAELCKQIFTHRRPLTKVIAAELPVFEGAKQEATKRRTDEATKGADVGLAFPSVASSLRRSVALPYHLYTGADIANRVIYVEASRGCPFKCEFCLSSLDIPVRNVPLAPFLAQMQNLLDRGCRRFKFVDRTFNLNLNTSSAILKFFLERYTDGLFVHFELIPDRLPEGLRELIRMFPPAALQFEVGIQSFNPEAEKLISRRQDHARLEDNLRWLRRETGVHIHADLIVGLPGEDLTSFGRGFDKLVALGPQEIQVGILKRLRGTPIVRHDVEWGMVYSPHAPYEVLQTNLVPFEQMQQMRRFSRYWDLIANSGNFVETLPLIWGDESPFVWFIRLTEWLYETTGQTHAIALTTLSELLFRFLVEQRTIDASQAAQSIWSDFKRIGRSDRPKFLEPFVDVADTRVVRPSKHTRQARHLHGTEIRTESVK